MKWWSYIENVESGKQVAPLYIKQAVARWRAFELRDDLYFDDSAAMRCVKFYTIFKHFKGKTAGKKFELLPWQQFIIAYILGWKVKATGHRLVKKVYIQIARKNGKTAFVAPLMLYLTFADKELGAEGDLAANSKEQAKICYEFVNEFCRQLDPKANRLRRYRDRINDRVTKSKTLVFAADASKLDGFDASVYILDEFHAAKDKALYNVLDSSQGAREQPLGIVITTAGFDKLSPCYEMRQTCAEVLQGAKEDDSLAAFIFELDENDEWTDEECWVKANPSLGVTVSKEFIRSKVVAAQNTPSEEVNVKTKTLNMWCESSEVWIPDHYIVEASKKIDLDAWRNAEAYCGIDLSATTDLAVIALCIPDEANGTFNYYAQYYLPEMSLKENRFKKLYGEWWRAGYLKLTPGNVVDYDIILEDLMKMYEKLQIISIAYDSWNATQFVINATARGLPMVPFSQTLGNFNRPTKELERQLLGGSAILDANEINRHCFRNAQLARDALGNIKVSKKNIEKKVDGAVAITMALGAYLKDPRYSSTLV